MTTNVFSSQCHLQIKEVRSPTIAFEYPSEPREMITFPFPIHILVFSQPSLFIITPFYFTVFHLRMLHNSLKSAFQTKEQELFELHLQLNGHSRTLFEEVLRKNNEIIKNCLARFSEVYNRYEEYDSTFKKIEEDICRLGDSQSNFHFEFRRTHLDIEKRQTQLTNDVSMLKNALKIPGRDTPPQVYLSSDFFKSRVGRVNTRSRQRDLSQNRAKTNYICPRKSRMREDAQTVSEYLQNQSIQTDKQDPVKASDCDNSQQSQIKNRNVEKKKACHKCSGNVVIDQQKKESQHNIALLISKEQFGAKIKQIQANLQSRLGEVTQAKRQCDWNHLNFDDLNRYINDTITQQLSNKVDKDYLQTSLFNLKEAWQAEEQQICCRLEGKVDQITFRQLRNIVEGIREQMERVKQTAGGKGGRLNINRSFNLPAATTPLPSSRAPSKDNLDFSQVMAKEICRNDSYIEQLAKKNSAFSSSLGTLGSVGRREKKTINVDILAETNFQNSISQKTWKDRVNEALGEGKSIKRTRNLH